MKRHVLITLALLLVSAAALQAQTNKSKIVRAGADRIENEYIVVLEDDVLPEQVPELARQLASAHGAKAEKTWRYSIKAFFVRMPEARAEALSRNPNVKYVEENAQWYLSADHQTYVNPITCDPVNGTCPEVVDNRLWHLDRADQNLAAPTNRYRYSTNGTGVTVYVIDSGVNKFHQEFAGSGRVQPGFNATGDGLPADDPCVGFAIPPTELFEENLYLNEVLGPGHGTSVASALGGKRTGIAKNVTIVPVKVIRCDRWTGRRRINSHFYQQFDTMYKPPVGATNPGTLYRANNSGFTAASDAGTWPTGSHQQRVDGGVVWEVIPISETNSTTQMLIDGLDWILSPSNPGPKSNAVVTLSTYRVATQAQVEGPENTVEQSIRNLLANNLTVVASANNQNGNACDTSPARLSINNPNPALANNVITAGGSMIINRPWGVDISDVGGNEADGPIGPNGATFYGPEPAYDSTKAVRDGRWICGPGDSSRICSNTTSTATINPALVGDYINFQGGSNAGPCVTLFAPAKNMFLATPAGFSAYRDARVRGGHASGTSWSAPVVAGFAARLLQANPTFTPVQVRTALLANSAPTLDAATLNTVDHLGNPITGTPNAMLRFGDVNITDQPDSTSSSQPVTLTVVASGTFALSYQWYEVNAGFDLVTYNYGAHSSTPIAGATSSSYVAPAPSSPKGYWVRVTNAAGTADSNIAVISPVSINPPTNVNALASGTSVTVTWTAASGATNYQVQRKISGQPWTVAGMVAGNVFSFNETPSAPGGMVLYRVLSATGTSPNFTFSAPSNNDFANVLSHTYEPLSPPPTVKAQHLIELRQAVNALCDAVGAPQQFAAGEVVLASLLGQLVADEHFIDLMTRANNIRTNTLVGVPAAGFSDTPLHGGLIRGVHLQSLRDALK